MGYYKFYRPVFAIKSQFQERKRLKAEVLTVNQFGVPVGTLMCSVDSGWLPTDDFFPAEMDSARAEYGSIAYLGKFAVLPWLKGLQVGIQLMKMAITDWAPCKGVDTILFMVHPDHAKFYGIFKAVELGRIEGTSEYPPAVLMALRLNCSEVTAIQREYRIEQSSRDMSIVGLGAFTS